MFAQASRIDYREGLCASAHAERLRQIDSRSVRCDFALYAKVAVPFLPQHPINAQLR